MTATKTFFIFNLVEKLRDSLKPVTSAGMTFFWLIFVVIGGKVEIFCLIWGIYARLGNKWLAVRNSFFH